MLNKKKVEARDDSWLRHYSTSRKVAGYVPHEFTAFLKLHNPSSRNIALEFTQALTEMTTRNLSGSKGRRVRDADLTPICVSIV
jgi:hypothetical protein